MRTQNLFKVTSSLRTYRYATEVLYFVETAQEEDTKRVWCVAEVRWHINGSLHIESHRTPDWIRDEKNKDRVIEWTFVVGKALCRAAELCQQFKDSPPKTQADVDSFPDNNTIKEPDIG